MAGPAARTSKLKSQTTIDERRPSAEFARQIDVPPNRVSQIIAGRRSIT
jgi:plasmid maintenance system antidote protein VapI